MKHAKESCGCGYPMCTRVADVLVSRQRKRNGFYTVDRHLDCLMCGPQVIRIELWDPPRYGLELVEPCRKIGPLLWDRER